MHVIKKRPLAENLKTSKIPYEQLTPSARLELESLPTRKHHANHHNNVVDLRKQSALRDLEALFTPSGDCVRTAS